MKSYGFYTKDCLRVVGICKRGKITVCRIETFDYNILDLKKEQWDGYLTRVSNRRIALVNVAMLGSVSISVSSVKAIAPYMDLMIRGVMLRS